MFINVYKPKPLWDAMKIDRIYIIGGPGCGKSYATNKLSRLTGLASFEMDKIYWHREDRNYKIKAPEKERDGKLRNIVKKKRWIIEGIFCSWTKPALEKADLIILLKCKKHLRAARILKRAFKRQFQKGQKKETFSSMIDYLVWNHKWDSNDFLRMEKVLKKYRKKVISFSKADNAVKFIITKRSSN